MVKVSPAVNVHAYPVVALASRLTTTVSPTPASTVVASPGSDEIAQRRPRAGSRRLAAPAAGDEQRTGERGQRQRPPLPTRILFSCLSPCLPPSLRRSSAASGPLSHATRRAAFVRRSRPGYHPGKGTTCPLSTSPPTAMTAARSHYDVIVVGAGPAGIFAALELVRRNGAKVLHRRARPRHLPPRLPGAQEPASAPAASPATSPAAGAAPAPSATASSP